MIKYSHPYLGDVNLLGLQKCHELPCTNILLTLRIGETPFNKDEIMNGEPAYLNIIYITDNFKGAGTDSDTIDELVESDI
jgi:hypothetical protein